MAAQWPLPKEPIMATKKSAKAPAKATKTSKTTKSTKPVAKAKTTAKKPVRRVAARPSVFDDLKPCKRAMSETEALKMYAEAGGIELKQMKAIVAKMNKHMAACLIKGGIGKWKLPGGMAQFTAKFVPAKKGGKKVPNPFKPGETMITRDKPAKMQIKGRPLTKLRNGVAI